MDTGELTNQTCPRCQRVYRRPKDREGSPCGNCEPDCPRCYGKGHEPDLAYTTKNRCLECGGTGKKRSKVGIVDKQCGHCRGMGYIPETGVTCRTCKGTGLALLVQINEEVIAPDPQRVDWDDYWFGIADAVSERHTCPRRKVGAVLVWRNKVLSFGYNGAPAGEPHCTEVGCRLVKCETHGDHCRRAVHAEINAIRQLIDLWGLEQARKYLEEAVLYTTIEPCHECEMEAREMGVEVFKWKDPYRS